MKGTPQSVIIAHTVVARGGNKSVPRPPVYLLLNWCVAEQHVWKLSVANSGHVFTKTGCCRILLNMRSLQVMKGSRSTDHK